MAVRVENNGVIDFGVMGAAVTVTHGRFQKAGSNPVVRPLASNVSAANGDRLRIPSGSMDVVYPAGQTTNDHMSAVVTPYWSGETFQVDLMTDDSTVVTTSGYSQQTHDAWTITTESD